MIKKSVVYLNKLKLLEMEMLFSYIRIKICLHYIITFLDFSMIINFAQFSFYIIY